jgi:hypothetical protein
MYEWMKRPDASSSNNRLLIVVASGLGLLALLGFSLLALSIVHR